ncbi:MAG: hypothetical protein KAH22_09790 [Thiotrichaceae bacterium]|nr:hypothetical protein [Thiotrichaceae bacterium]
MKLIKTIGMSIALLCVNGAYGAEIKLSPEISDDNLILTSYKEIKKPKEAIYFDRGQQEYSFKPKFLVVKGKTFVSPDGLDLNGFFPNDYLNFEDLYFTSQPDKSKAFNSIGIKVYRQISNLNNSIRDAYKILGVGTLSTGEALPVKEGTALYTKLINYRKVHKFYKAYKNLGYHCETNCVTKAETILTDMTIYINTLTKLTDTLPKVTLAKIDPKYKALNDLRTTARIYTRNYVFGHMHGTEKQTAVIDIIREHAGITEWGYDALLGLYDKHCKEAKSTCKLPKKDARKEKAMIKNLKRDSNLLNKISFLGGVSEWTKQNKRDLRSAVHKKSENAYRVFSQLKAPKIYDISWTYKGMTTYLKALDNVNSRNKETSGGDNSKYLLVSIYASKIRTIKSGIEEILAVYDIACSVPYTACPLSNENAIDRIKEKVEYRIRLLKRTIGMLYKSQNDWTEREKRILSVFRKTR